MPVETGNVINVSEIADGRPRQRATLALVRITPPISGRPLIRITRAMPPGMLPEAAIALARAAARANPVRRFQVVDAQPGGAAPRVVWDSHAPS